VLERIAIFVLLLVATAAAGYIAGRASAKAENLNAVVVAQTEEHRLSNRAAVGYLTRLEEQERVTDGLREELQAALGKSAECPVSVRVVRVLDRATSSPRDPPRVEQPSPPPVPPRETRPEPEPEPEPSSTAGAELEICRKNYVEVCVPNALQLQALQEWYEELRKQRNR
jgi:hypothetical protein